MALSAARKRGSKGSTSFLAGGGGAAAAALVLLLLLAVAGVALASAASSAAAAASKKTLSSSRASSPLLSAPSEPGPLTLDIPGLISGGLKQASAGGGRTLAGKRFASWKRSNGDAPPSPSSSSSSSTSSSTSAPSSSTSSSPSCSALVTVTPTWNTLASGNPAVSLDVTITNSGPAAVPTPWDVKLVSTSADSSPASSSSPPSSPPSYASVLQAWNLEKTGILTSNDSSQALSGQATGYWQAIPPNGGSASFGMILELSKDGGESLGGSLASSSAAAALLPGAPTALELNGRACALTTEVAEPSEPAMTLPVSFAGDNNNETTSSSTPLPTPLPTTPAVSPALANSSSDGGATIIPGRMTTLDGKIIGVDGRPLFLMGLNWFGFDCGATMVDGLWGGKDATAQDFANVVYRIKLLGFNAVRLPFSFRDLYDKSPKWLNTKCTSVPPDAVAALTRPPTVSASSTGPPPPPGDVFAVSSPPGTCNSYMPQQNTLDRFLWTVDYLARAGLYVMLDNQFNLDQTATQQPALWVQRWTDLATKLTRQYPLAASMSLIDILNEPDAWGVGWTPQNGKPGYGDMSLKIMDALYAVNPGFLYVLEGCGQANLAKNWGDGMAVDAALVKNRGLTDPNPFFRTLMTKPYLSQVVAGPHVYSPSVSSAQDSTQGPALYKRLSQSFGYLNKQGYCLDSPNTVGGTTNPNGNATNCHVFPVVIGETGTGFIDPRDLQPQLDLAAWAVARPGSGSPADDGLHNPVQGFFWWAWNANGDGQMGIVQNDWTTIDWNKIRYLESVGLRPWYKNNGTQPVPPPSPTPSPTTPPPPATTTPPPTTKPPTPPPTTLPPTPPPTTTPPAPTTTPPQTWPVAPMVPPVTPAETRRGRPPRAGGEDGDGAGGGGEGGVLGSDVFVSGDAPGAGDSTTTPLQAPLPTPSAAAAAAASQEISNAVEAAVDESAASGSPVVNNAPSISSSPPPPQPVSLGSMVGEVFSWAAQDASPPLQPGGSTGEAAASSESFGDGGGRPLSTRGSLLLGSDGAPFDLKAVAWPGFDSEETGGWLQGLSPGPASSAALPTTADADARTQFARMRALGFTAVKLPFSMPVVLGKTKAPAGAAGASPEVECSVTPEAEVRDATAPASSPPTAWNHWPEGAELPSASTTKTAASATTATTATATATAKCNAGAPPFSSAAPPLARLAWAAARAAEAGLYVVLEDAGPTAAEDPALWVDGWSRVAAAVANAPLEKGNDGLTTVGSRLALRLLADPDALSLSWETPGAAAAAGAPASSSSSSSSSSGATGAGPTRPPPPSLRRLALAAMDSLSRVAPSALLLVPGGGQAALFGNDTSSSSTVQLTGAGFATDPAALAAAGIDPLASADGFLTELVGTRASYLDRVVLSPTLGIKGSSDADVEGEFPSFAPQRLWRALDASFGALTSRGFCLGGGGGSSSCHRFAVVVGGLGGPAWASDRAARLRSDVAAWLQPTCGLPACAASASAAGAARPAVRSWSWGEWKGEEAGASSSPSSSAALLLPSPPPPPSSSAAASASASSSVPLVDWKQVEWLQKGLGLLPWTAAPSTAWREGPGPAPTDVLRAAGNPPSSSNSNSTSSGTVSAESEGAAALCAAVYSVDARGAAAEEEQASSGTGRGSNNSTSAAVASVVLTLANLGRAAAVAPPFVISMANSRQGGGGGYSAVLQAHGVSSAHVVVSSSSGASGAGGGAVRARVSDPWSVLWPAAGSSVSVSLVVRGGSPSSSSSSPSAAAAALSLAPTDVSINGVPCSVSRAADATASAEGEGFGKTTRSVMQTSRGFPLQQAAV